MDNTMKKRTVKRRREFSLSVFHNFPRKSRDVSRQCPRVRPPFFHVLIYEISFCIFSWTRVGRTRGDRKKVKVVEARANPKGKLGKKGGKEKRKILYGVRRCDKSRAKRRESGKANGSQSAELSVVRSNSRPFDVYISRQTASSIRQNKQQTR